MVPSISDVAKKAGVSVTTVSRAFHNQSYVSEKVKEKIFSVADELNYTPKEYKKRKVVSTNNSIIGVIVPDITNSYFTGIVRGIETVAEENGYDVVVCDTKENPGREVRAISTLHNCKIAGLIVTVASDAVEYNAEYLRELNDSGTPVVFVDRDLRVQGIDGVVIDNYHGAYSAVQALIDGGHRKIAILSGPTTSKTGIDRLNGYLQALRDNKIEMNEGIISYGDFSVESGYELTKRLLKSRRDVTAIFSANQRMTLGCLQALNEEGYSVPNDIALISFGVSDTILAMHLPVSHVYQPGAPLGEESARILFNKLNMGKRYKKMPTKQTVFSTECQLLGSEKLIKKNSGII